MYGHANELKKKASGLVDLNKYLHMIGIVEGPTYIVYCEGKEDLQHALDKCLTRLRYTSGP